MKVTGTVRGPHYTSLLQVSLFKLCPDKDFILKPSVTSTKDLTTVEIFLEIRLY